MAKRRKSAQVRTQQKLLTRDQVNIQGEANYVIDRAKQHDARVVTLGAVVLFSTETGDAWMLDPEDSFALCLARDGVVQPYTIIDTPTNFSIEWNADYTIDGNVFVVAERSGRIRSIMGYPVREILQAMRRNKNLRGLM